MISTENGFDKVLRVWLEEFKFLGEARLKGQTRGKQAKVVEMI